MKYLISQLDIIERKLVLLFSHLLKQLLLVSWHICCLSTLPFHYFLACIVNILHVYAYVLAFNDFFS